MLSGVVCGMVGVSMELLVEGRMSWDIECAAAVLVVLLVSMSICVGSSIGGGCGGIGGGCGSGRTCRSGMVVGGVV